MNEQCYRLIFCRTRNMLVAVSEDDSAHGGGSGRTNGIGIAYAAHKWATLRSSAFAVLNILGMVWITSSVQAQIIADSAAPGNQQPTVLLTANGVPQVNIQTPSAAGVSRNTYSQFDVQSNGAILNNSRTNTQTQTGGWIQANPWLAAGSARVILNEVNSSNSSHLRGYVEVAGQGAEVIIANPAGVRVNGGGFINADRVTLVTGSAVLNHANGGALDSYRVTEGTISIDGLGLDTRTASHTDILARSIEVNAGIWANRLKVVTGANDISLSSADYPGNVASVVRPIAGSGPAPTFSLDVAAVGGMYAGHIYLVGSEAGVGVRNHGTLSAGGGNLVLTTEGYLTNVGAMQAASADGTAGNVRIHTAGGLTNSGVDAMISAQGTLSLTSDAVTNTDGAVLAAGGPLDITVIQTIDNTQATVAALGSVTFDGAVAVNASGLVASVNGGIAIHSTDETRNIVAAGATQGARISAAGDINLSNAGLHNTGTSSITGHNVSIDTHSQPLDNSQGTLTATGALTITGAALTNSAGQIQAIGDIALHAGSGSIDNTGGLVRSGGTASLHAGLIVNSNTDAADQGIEGLNVALDAHTLANDHGAIRADNTITLTSSGSVDNTSGLISAVAAATVQDSATNKTLAISNTGGTLIAGKMLSIDAANLGGDGNVLSVQDLNLALSGDYLHSGKLKAGGTLTASARNIGVTASGEISAANTTLSAQGTLTNRGLIDGINTRINAETLTNIGTGRIYGDHIGIAATTLNNDSETVNGTRADAVIAARERLDIGVQTLNNREHAMIFSAGPGANALNIGGALDQDGHATGQAGTVNNSSATIESLGDLNIASATLNNTNAHFSSVVEQVSGPTNLLYIQPSGSGSKLLASNFVWESWSRAGQYRYVTSPAPNNSGILGQSPIPRVGEQDCVGDQPDEVCTRQPGADYLSDNPAWAWFGITPPAIEPTQPTLAVPVAPDPAGASSCQAGAGYNASACTAYNDALDTYNSEQQIYDAVWADYYTAHAAWETDTDARYTQLDNSIATYNQGFAHLYVRAWTQFNVTRTESESQVATSDPGQILSGGDMRLTGGDLVNDKSRIIAGGTLNGDLANLRNIEAEGVHIVHESGTSQYTYSDWRGGFKRYHERRWDAPIAYNPADQITTITLAVTERRQNTAPAGSGTQVAARTILSGGTEAAGAGNAGPGAINVLTLNTPVSLPSNSLFRQNPNPDAQYLIETDARFTDMRQWLGSDYMLVALGNDPSTVQKRLGDGFYEQKLIREQVAQLTGRRFLDGYANDEAQYRALMDAGITVAQEWSLVPGVALSAVQIAQLTSDIVWLVSEDVTLADGSKHSVLVPKVYLQVREGDLRADGTLLAGASLHLNLSGDALNSGTIAGRDLVQLSAQNVNNFGGRITGSDVAVQARDDLNNIGGQISARNALLALAGRDLNVVSTTQTTGNEVGLSSFSRTALDRVAGLYVTGDAAGNGALIAAAGRDINITAAAVSNTAAQGSTLLQAGRDIQLGTVQTAVQEDNIRNSTNYLKQGGTQEVGSQIVAASSIDLVAGQDISARAATVDAGAALTVLANRDVTISAGEASSNLGEAHQHTSKSLTGSKTRTTRVSNEDTMALASSFGGEMVLVHGGRDVAVLGSNVVADADLAIVAGNDLTIAAVDTSHTSSSFQETKKSGLFSSGLSVTLGKQEQSVDQQTVRTGVSGSAVGSVQGDIVLVAGNAYLQRGSEVLAPGGDISIAAGRIDIVERREVSQSETEMRFKQSGVTITVSNPVLDAVQTVQQMQKAASQTDDTRMKALAGATSALALKNAADAVTKGLAPKPVLDAAGQPVMNPDGTPQTRDANAAEQVGGINVSISVGSSKSQSNTTTSSDSAAGSAVVAGGDIRMVATGAGEQSNITIQGSTVSAQGNASLIADNQINLLAAANTAEQHSTSSAKSGSIGVSFGTNGFMVNASASKSRGNASGDDLSWTNTKVEAGQRLTLQSGGDTMLKGAVAAAEQVKADIGGNLHIESLQDISNYTNRQRSAGGSISVGMGAVGGSINASKSNIDAHYASVVEQSGVRAGDGGFEVNVQGHTTSVGGAITSTELAVREGHNTFTTNGQTAGEALTSGVLTLSDLHNREDYSARSASVSLGAGAVQSLQSPSASLTGVGLGRDSGSAHSTTVAAISGMAGNQAARTGDAETGIQRIFDADKVRREIEAQVQITQEFSKHAGQAIDHYMEAQRKALEEQAKSAMTAEDKAQAQQALKDLNMQERALNILVGALTGMGGTMVTKEALSFAAEQMRDLMIEDSMRFAGVVDSTGQMLDNIAGESVGVRGDGIKLGGTRVDLDGLCGPSNERCVTNNDGTLKLDAQGRVQFDDVAVGMSMADFLKTPEGKKLVGPTGGVQGMAGTMFGIPYAAGSWVDRLVEAFAGSHDYIGGGISGLYDGQGNAKRGMSELESKSYDVWSGVAIPVAAPFAAAEGVSRDVWQAIYILLRAAR